MHSVERGGHHPEQEPAIYYQAARYTGEKSAGVAYAQAQDIIYKADCEMSAYRFQLNRLWHVAVLGDIPPDDLKEHLDTILSLGVRVTLPADILGILRQRRADAIKTGPWLEGHYRPGRPLL